MPSSVPRPLGGSSHLSTELWAGRFPDAGEEMLGYLGQASGRMMENPLCASHCGSIVHTGGC